MLNYLVLKCCNTFRRLASADFSDRLLYTCTFFVYVSDLKIGKLKSTLFVELLCLFFSSQYVFITEQTLDNKKTIHEQLSKYLMTTLKPGADPVVVNDLMKVLHCHKIQIEREARRESSKRGEWGAGWGVGFFRVL